MRTSLLIHSPKIMNKVVKWNPRRFNGIHMDWLKFSQQTRLDLGVTSTVSFSETGEA